MSGSAGTKRKKTHIPSDFKRRKAKVGKRAPQQLNLTDTSFKAVSVQVQGQSIAESKDGGKHGASGILSSRGKSIADLTHQLHHPAAAVRISAIRGLANVIQGTSFHILETHLSILLPVIAKCACVDDELDVRTLGLLALRELIAKPRWSDDGRPHDNNANTHQYSNNKMWKPFVPLLAAFITSALNSLDRATRLDGSRAVDILSQMPLDRITVATILPAYITLLQDHTTHTNNSISANITTKTAVEGKMKKKTDENKRLVILQSMVSLLKSIVDAGDMLSMSASKFMSLEHADLTLLPASSNALVLLPSCQSHPVEAPSSSSWLMTMMKDGVDPSVSEQSRNRHSTDDGAMTDSILDDLFFKLRDVFVEATQRGTQSQSGVTMGLADMEEVSLLVSSIHLLWKCFATKNRKNTVASNLVNMMLESMPIRSRSQDQLARYEALNGNICFSVIEMGSDLMQEAKWTDAILEYLLPKLEAQNMNQSAITMNVLWGLIHLKNTDDMPAIGETTLELVLKRITNVYFSGASLDADVSRSLGARKAVKLAISLLMVRQLDKVSESLIHMVQYFPHYLMAWGGDYLEESDHALELLIFVVRRTNVAEKSSGLMASLRQGLGALFTVASKQAATVFELYSLEMQRKTICLVVSLESPTRDLLTGLGKISAKAGTGIPHHLADYILDVMHTTRTTMQIQDYLGFVISSIGVPKKSTPAPQEKGGSCGWICTRDKATLRASRALRRCGIRKVLPMIATLLNSWLKPASEEAFVRFRVALLLLSTFAQDEDIFDYAPELRIPLQKAIMDFFQACSWESEKPDVLVIFERALLVRMTGWHKATITVENQIEIKLTPAFVCRLCFTLSRSF
jgi:hypothetical protein